MTFQSNGQVIVQSCTKYAGKPIGDAAPTCGAATPLNIPNNGAIYTGQPVIVSGVVNGRVTIGSASDIYIGGNLSYAQDGDDVLGLVASHSVIVAQWVPTTLSWRAATIAQSGTWRSYGFDPQTGQSEADYVGNFRLHFGDVHRLDRNVRRRLDGPLQHPRVPVRQHARVPAAALVPDDPGRVHGRALARSSRDPWREVLKGPSSQLTGRVRATPCLRGDVAGLPGRQGEGALLAGRCGDDHGATRTGRLRASGQAADRHACNRIAGVERRTVRRTPVTRPCLFFNNFFATPSGAGAARASGTSHPSRRRQS